jgi:hypothetical protein
VTNREKHGDLLDEKAESTHFVILGGKEKRKWIALRPQHTPHTPHPLCRRTGGKKPAAPTGCLVHCKQEMRILFQQFAWFKVKGRPLFLISRSTHGEQ